MATLTAFIKAFFVTFNGSIIPTRNTTKPKRLLLLVSTKDSTNDIPPWLKSHLQKGDLLYGCQTRGTGNTRWTQTNPPNYVERAHVLLGDTVDARCPNLGVTVAACRPDALIGGEYEECVRPNYRGDCIRAREKCHSDKALTG